MTAATELKDARVMAFLDSVEDGKYLSDMGANRVKPYGRQHHYRLQTGVWSGRGAEPGGPRLNRVRR